MSHQDWEIVSFSNSKRVEEKNKNNNQHIIQNRQSDAEKSVNAKNYKLESEQENFLIEYIPKELGREIIQLRTLHKLNQKELAQKIYVQLAQIQNIETGRALYNQDTKKIIKQIEKTFKVIFINK